MIFQLIHSDVYAGLTSLPKNYIDCAVTSPPYWGQRDYGFRGQIGNENTYLEYISKLITVYNILKDKLTKEGIFFLNIGDKYISKYGKSPLGLIPYKLVYFMTKNGWFLNDILIWFKPNHMPSSVKNRFSNTYEPVFVLSKSKSNYYTKFKKLHPNLSRILKINVQLTPYKHMAVYPEKLVEELLLMLDIPDDAIILDPFSGSGTTGKGVLNLNSRLLENKNFSFIMIEKCDEYINIIKKRCKLKGEDIKHLPTIKYKVPKINEETFTVGKGNSKIPSIIDEKGFIKVTSNKKDYYNLIKSLIEGSINKNLRPDATIFIGTKEFDIDLIYKTSLLNNKGWVIRNMLIISNGIDYYPIFMIVDDNKKYEYLFNLQKIKVSHKHSNQNNWSKVDFTGYKVYDKFHKQNIKGVIANVIEKYPNGFPKWVIALWNNNDLTKEYIIYENEDMDDKVGFFCPKCNLQLKYYYNPFALTKCPNCDFKIWDKTYPKIVEDEDLIREFSKDIDSIINNSKYAVNSISKNKSKDYKGKFKDTPRINHGASPGARSSTQEEYFTVKRLYNVDQKMVCDYLNLKRIQKKLSKKALTEKFPYEYKHTVGHWLRKDFGGSIPLPKDWTILKEILNLDNSFTNYVCRTGLKLQIVKSSEKGKNPGDYLEMDSEAIINILKKIF